MSDAADRLVWSWDVVGGKVTAKLAYDALFAENHTVVRWWDKTIWKLVLPLKIKCFVWLAMWNKILTWDNLCRRGFCGSGWCTLCCSQEESVDHLFSTCHFIWNLWIQIVDKSGVQFCWNHNSLCECLEAWSHVVAGCSELPYFMIWEVWKARNSLIFENRTPFCDGICYKTIAAHKEFTSIHADIGGRNYLNMRNRLAPPVLIFPCGFFDGAAMGRRGMGGAGAVIHISCSVSIHIWLNLGIGTNTRSELCAFWLLLFWARLRKITSLVVLGDSLSIISWARGSSSLKVLLLSHWMDAARKLILEFDSIHFEHVFREVNLEADMLSKRALTS